MTGTILFFMFALGLFAISSVAFRGVEIESGFGVFLHISLFIFSPLSLQSNQMCFRLHIRLSEWTSKSGIRDPVDAWASLTVVGVLQMKG